MKTYVEPERIRIAGKAWEIRHRVKRMIKEAGSAELPLKRYLEERCKRV